MDDKLKRLIEHITEFSQVDDSSVESGIDPPLHIIATEEVCQGIYEIWDIPQEEIARVVAAKNRQLENQDR